MEHPNSSCADALRFITSPSSFTLLYGPAGSGKTSLAIEAVKHACRGHCLYASTERLDFLRRAEQANAPLDRMIVFLAVSADDFAALAVRRNLPLMDIVVVDSINAFARDSEEAQLYTILLAAVLRRMTEDYSTPVLATAQVHATEEGVEPVLARPLLEYSTLAGRLERAGQRRLLELFNPHTGEALMTAEFRITSGGVEWLKCSAP